MLKSIKRRRIKTKSLQHLNPPDKFRYIGSDENEWNVITDKKQGVIYYITSGGYRTQNDKLDGIRVILKPITVLLIALLFSSCNPSYVRYRHKTRNQNPVFAEYDTVRVYTLFGHNDFEIIKPAPRNCYEAWDLRTREFAIISATNLHRK